MKHTRRQLKTVRNGVVRSGASAGFNQMRHSPREWTGASGFGKRFASALGTHATKSAIQFGVGSLRKEDLSYHRSHKHGFLPRMKTALVSTVVARKRHSGKRTVASGRLAGAMGSGMISRTWQPARLHTVGSGLSTGGIALGAEAGTNVAREFWPEIKRGFRGKTHRARRSTVR